MWMPRMCVSSDRYASAEESRGELLRQPWEQCVGAGPNGEGHACYDLQEGDAEGSCSLLLSSLVVSLSSPSLSLSRSLPQSHHHYHVE